MVDVIAQILGAVVMGLFMAWLLRSVSPKAGMEAGKHVLSYGRSMKLLGVGGVILWVSLILLMVSTATEEILMPLIIFAAFALLSLYLTLEAYSVRVLYDEAFIYYYSFWRKERKIGWYDIKAITFSSFSQYFICETTFDGKLRLSLYLSGVQEFLQEAERRGIPVPPAP
ncbi:MAG: hypothetical protein DYG89_42495 [Caldilinea sp. CFX5]|nr:hypothetical protein [Caldilinea sp. CFX5]